MKALVISGGGAFGAYTVGTLLALKKKYKIVCGVSTGALMAPFCALGYYDRLKDAYTSVDQDSIFDYNPFTKNGKLNPIKIAPRIFFGKPTWGESNNLRKLIDKWFLAEDYDYLSLMGKKVVVATQNVSIRPSVIEYFDNKIPFEDFKDYMWASANAPLVMSLLRKGGQEYVDGGLTELHTLDYALKLGATEVDVMMHRQKDEPSKRDFIKNSFHLIGRLLKIRIENTEDEDLKKGLHLAQDLGVKVNIYWLPRKLAGNSLVFDKQVMLDWVQEGSETAFDKTRIDTYDYGNY